MDLPQPESSYPSPIAFVAKCTRIIIKKGVRRRGPLPRDCDENDIIADTHVRLLKKYGSSYPESLAEALKSPERDDSMRQAVWKAAGCAFDSATGMTSKRNRRGRSEWELVIDPEDYRGSSDRIATEEAIDLQEAEKGLSPAELKVFRLKQEGKTHEDIGKIFGIRKQKVSVILAKAIKLLKAALA